MSFYNCKLWFVDVKNGHDIFVLVIKFLRANWQPKNITFDFYEATNINGQTLPINLTKIVEHLWAEEENYYLC